MTILTAEQQKARKPAPPQPEEQPKSFSQQVREKEIAEITKLAGEGKTAEQIAAAMGYKAHYVNKIAKAEKISIPTASELKAWSDEQDREIVATLNDLALSVVRTPQEVVVRARVLFGPTKNVQRKKKSEG